MEVLFQINRGWFPAELTDGFRRQLEAYHGDLEFLTKGGEWQRAALVTLYSTVAGAQQPAAEDSCLISMEGGSSVVTWRKFKQNSRPYDPMPEKGFSFDDIEKEAWDQAIDDDPLNWTLRGVYADWLEDAGQIVLMEGQRYQIEHQKTPGPACVQESAWHEATWFVEYQANSPWGLSGGRRVVVKPEWCVPIDVFAKLSNYIIQRRDGGSHNHFAKSWNSRRRAETCLALSLKE